MKEYESAFPVWFCIMLGFIAIASALLISHISYAIGKKAGYEDAVEDIYNGKLKCERVEKTIPEYIWRKSK